MNDGQLTSTRIVAQVEVDPVRVKVVRCLDDVISGEHARRHVVG